MSKEERNILTLKKLYRIKSIEYLKLKQSDNGDFKDKWKDIDFKRRELDVLYRSLLYWLQFSQKSN